MKRSINIPELGLLLVLLFTHSQTARSQPESGRTEDQGGSPPYALGADDQMSEQQVREIQDQIAANIERLKSDGKIPLIPPPPAVTFLWPMKKASGLREFNLGFITAFVDHNPAFPGSVLDWNCGVRTYDGGISNNHLGTDIYSQPFPWKRLDNNEAYAVAAAEGVIVQKIDGNFDHNCVTGNPNWNAVFLLHADGSITWYGHLKNGALTKKQIGDSVAAGEYLGIVGSSGSSRAPHVHFQVYNAANQLQDPYQGACNSMNIFSWWVQQEPYRNSQILALTTATAQPEFPPCPQQEISNEKIVFQPGELFYATSYFRDQVIGQETQYSILRPDGSQFAEWSVVSPATYEVLRYWFRPWQLPLDAALGRWTFRAVYNGQTYETNFYVGQPPDVSVGGQITSLSGLPVSRATIVLSGNGLESRIARTNPFGYYRMSEVTVGKTYAVNVQAKGLTFLPRNITIGGELDAFDHFSLNDR